MMDGSRIQNRVALALLGWMFLAGSAVATDWIPVQPEDLGMTQESSAPHAAAVFLYRQVDRDDNLASEVIYERIKILTEEGRSYGNVQIPYDRGNERITGIDARVIRPDGGIQKFDGEIFDQPLAKSRQARLFVKTFSLPDVRLGSIVEYRYRRTMNLGWVYNSHWILNAPLFTRLARFSLSAAEGFALRWSWPSGLPEGTRPPEKHYGKVQLEARNIPAFVAEDYSPPEDLLKMRVDFIYSDPDEFEKSADTYWKKRGKALYREVDGFIDQRSAMKDALAQIVQPDDPPETRLRKIYARVQQLRNLTFERDKTEEENDRESLKKVHDVEDLWKLGYGTADQINWLFLALVRHAGLQADPVQVSTRDLYFFLPELMNKWQLNTSVIRVIIDGQERYFDPGTPFSPFGMLPWNETKVAGRVLDHDGGYWVVTSMPSSIESRIERKASLELSEQGSLSGRLTITYSGLEALTRRLAERNADRTERKQYLEEQVKDLVPVGIKVELANEPDWSGASTTLVAQFRFNVQGWAMGTGNRMLMPVSLFPGELSHVVSHGMRKYPLYFEYPYQQNDYVSIRLPASMSVESLPGHQGQDIQKLAYSLNAGLSGSVLNLDRQVTVNDVLIASTSFEQFRGFFQSLKSADEEQVVLSAKRAAK